MSKSKTYIVFILLFLLACQAESSELKTSVLVDEAVDKGISFVAKKTKKWFGKKKPNKGDAKKQKEENKKSGKPDEITAKDKAKHAEIGKKISSKLKEKSTSLEEEYEAFHKKKAAQANRLENQYQPQLKKGINLDVKVLPLAADKKDNDVDVTIRIAPNDFVQKVAVAFKWVGGKYYVINVSNLEVRKATMKEAMKLPKKAKIGDKVGSLMYVGSKAEVGLIKKYRIIKTAIARQDDFRALYVGASSKVEFLKDVEKALNLENTEGGVEIDEKFKNASEKAVQLLYQKFKDIFDIKDNTERKDISQARYERIREMLDGLPDFEKFKKKTGKKNAVTPGKIGPALAIAYDSVTGAYEFEVNTKSTSYMKDLHPQVIATIKSIQRNFRREVIEKYGGDIEEEEKMELLDVVVGREKMGQHAEVRAVSRLLQKLDVGKGFNTKRILVAFIKSSSKEIGYAFVRCPNCTIALNMVGVTTITESESFLGKSGAYNEGLESTGKRRKR